MSDFTRLRIVGSPSCLSPLLATTLAAIWSEGLHRRQRRLCSITVRPSALAVLRLMANSNLVEARQAGQRPSPPNELRSCLISGLSYRTTFNKELWISRFPLYLI